MARNGSFPERFVFALLLFLLAAGLQVHAHAQDVHPVIIIPGITGSELVNEKTGELVWFKTPRSKDDDLRLPITSDPTKSRDGLVPGDILRSVRFGFFPRIDVYQGLIEALETRGGYHEEKWDSPTENAGGKAIFVFPYDWRLDNVGNARLLVRKVTELKAKLKRPGLKFNIIAHSMGGLIARYAAMYGDADLPAGNKKPVVTWAGAAHFDKIVLLGTPNGGSIHALDAITNGFSITGINISLPWIQNLSKFDLFTIPAAYQLLPSPDAFRAVDENFEPVNIDLYDPKEWSKYGWNVIDDRRFTRQFAPAEVAAASDYFTAVLDRARRLHKALAENGHSRAPVHISLVGSECKDTLDTILLLYDEKREKWRTMFKPDDFTKSSGVKVSSGDVKDMMPAPGDGVVTQRSLERDVFQPNGKPVSASEAASSLFVCEEHNKLPGNKDVQKYLIGLFAAKDQIEKGAKSKLKR